jgi:hypothetical protein
LEDWLTGNTKNGHGLDLNLAVQIASWPTPTAKIKAGGEYKDPDKAMARAMGPHSNDLRDFAQMASRPTPTTSDFKGSGPTLIWKDGQDRTFQRLDFATKQGLAGWLTPTGQDGNALPTRIDGLKDQAEITGPARFTASGETLIGSTAGMESGGQLNPRFSGFLMGYPLEWCLAAPGMDGTSSPRSSKGRRRASGV